MTPHALTRRQTLQAAGIALAGGLATGPTSAQSDQPVVVTLEPSDPAVDVSEATTLDVVVRGAQRGISSYSKVTVETDPAVATIQHFEETANGLHDSTLSEDRSRLTLSAALLDDTHPPAAEIVLARVTLWGEQQGETTLTVDDGAVYDDQGVQKYDSRGMSRTLSVGSPEPLVPSLDWTPAEPDVGEAVTFDASGSTGPITEYRWTVADETNGPRTTTDPTVTHAFQSPGTHGVVLTVVDGDGRSASETAEIHVRPEGNEDDGSDGDNGNSDGDGDNSDANGDEDGSSGEDDSSDGDGSDDDSSDDSNDADESDGDGDDESNDEGPADDGGGSSDEDSGDDGDGGDDGTEGGNDPSDDGAGNADEGEQQAGGSSADDAFGPGFGPLSALAGLGGVGYFLGRWVGPDGEDE